MKLFWIQFRWEVRKLFARRRTHLGFAVFVVSEIVLLLLLQLDSVRGLIRRDMLRAGASFAADFSGLTLAEFMMSNTMSAVGVLFIALVAGDIVAKEAEDGTLRTVFARPVSRGAVMLQKYFVVVLYSATTVFFVGACALLLGLLFEGPGNAFFWSFKEGLMAWFPFWPGLARYALALPLLSLSMLSIATVAFTFSCCNMKPAAATALTLSLFIADESLRHVPALRPVRDSFLTSHVIAWAHVYDPIIPWPFLKRNYALLLSVDAGLLAIAYTQFRRRDFKP